MKGEWYVIGSVLCLAVFNNMIERRMKGVSGAVVVVCVNAILVVLSLFILAFLQHHLRVQWPDMKQWSYLIVGGLILTPSPHLIMLAYNNNVSAIVVTTMMILVPVFITGINLAFNGVTPTPREIISWLFATGAILTLIVGKK